MDLAYLRAHPEHLPTFLTHQRIRETPIRGGSIAATSRLTLDDGHSVFMKTWPDASSATSPATGSSPTPQGLFEAEAAGIGWLSQAPGGAPLPEIVVAQAQLLVLEWIEEGPPTATAARAFGAMLARTHQAAAGWFGGSQPSYIGALPLDNTPTPGPWSSWFAERRLRPYLRISSDRGALGPADVQAVERLLDDIERYAGDADLEPPARIHGDLWPGNLLWSATGPVYLIDPAAQGGHRETDLATLALFGGAPHLGEIIDAYQEVWPLASGWSARRPLHQLHLLLVHTAMFGSAYRNSVMDAIRATVDQ